MASKTVHSLTPYYLSNLISFCFLPKLTSLQPDSFFFSFSLNSSLFYLRALLYLLPKMLFPQVDRLYSHFLLVTQTATYHCVLP